jgi:anti-sigma factor RsiW
MFHDIDPILIRLYCDGELSPEQAAEMERHLKAHPEARASIAAQIQFERNLRNRIGEVIQRATPAAPAGLLQQIRSMHTDPAVVGRLEGNSLAAEVSGVSGSNSKPNRNGMVRPTKSRTGLFNWLQGPRQANVFAVAASLALVVGAVMIGIFGRPIDDHLPGHSSDQAPGATTADLVSDAAVFADTEHRRCSGDMKELERKAAMTAPRQAAGDLSDWLEADVIVPNLDQAGYGFCGAGRCELPGTKQAGHFVYRKRVESGERAPMASIFVCRNEGQFNCSGGCLKPGQWYSCTEDVGCKSKCRLEVARSTDGELVYFLVCCNMNDLLALKQVITSELGDPRR